MKILLLFVFVTFSVLSVAQSSVLIVGGDFDYPPYSFINSDGEEVGYDVDIIKALSELCSLDVEFRFDNWDSTLLRLELGQVDLIASIVYSESREHKYDFTFPLHTEYYAIFAKKETEINDVLDLESKMPACLNGDISNEKFLNPLGLLKKYVSVSSMPEAFGFIAAGVCDYVIAPYPLGMKMIKEEGLKSIEVKGPPIIPSVYCLAVRQGDAELLAQLNMGIEQLSRNGELQRIYDKWIEFKREDDQYKSLFAYLLYVLIGLLLITIIIFIFWYSLRRQVLKSTKQMKESEEIYQKVFDTVADAMVIINKNGFITHVNKKLMEMYELSYSQLVGVHGSKVINANNQGVLDKFLELMKRERYFYYETTRLNKVSGLVYLNVEGVSVYLGGEERYLVVMHNVTKEKEAFLELEDAKIEAESANKTKSAFLSTISHEIRTPLNAVIGYSNLLAKTKLTTKQIDYNDKVCLSGNMLLNLVNDVLDFTKIEANKLELVNEPFILKEIIDEVCGIQKLKVKEKGLILNIEVDENIPYILLGDRLRVLQVLLNLLNNAIKFTHQGEVSLKVNIENMTGDLENRTCIMFSIKDTGIGISIDHQMKLFQPFEQAQNTNKRIYGGTGLGLAISKQLVELMGGKIICDSSVNKGSVFNVSIPFKVYTDSAKLIKYVNDDNYEDIDINSISILLVEDNKFNAEVLIELMVGFNTNIKHANSGKKAIALFKDNIFDVVLMDIEMPEMDGFETTEAIKKIDVNDTPIIALSAHTLGLEKKKALEVGMVDYLSKPIETHRLIKIITKHINNRQAQKTKPFFYADGLQFFNGDVLMYEKTLGRFKSNYSALYNDMLSMFENDKKQLKRHTHNLKSALKMIGADKLSQTVAKVDIALRENAKTIKSEKIQQISKDLKVVIDLIDVD